MRHTLPNFGRAFRSRPLSAVPGSASVGSLLGGGALRPSLPLSRGRGGPTARAKTAPAGFTLELGGADGADEDSAGRALAGWRSGERGRPAPSRRCCWRLPRWPRGTGCAPMRGASTRRARATAPSRSGRCRRARRPSARAARSTARRRRALASPCHPQLGRQPGGLRRADDAAGRRRVSRPRQRAAPCARRPLRALAGRRGDDATGAVTPSPRAPLRTRSSSSSVVRTAQAAVGQGPWGRPAGRVWTTTPRN
jgi:hypothetical protein